VFIRVIFIVIWEIIENYFDIWHYIDDIKEGEQINANNIKKKEKEKKNKKKTEIGHRSEILERTPIWEYH